MPFPYSVFCPWSDSKIKGSIVNLSHRCPFCPRQSKPGPSSPASSAQQPPASPGGRHLDSLTESVCVCCPASGKKNKKQKPIIYYKNIFTTAKKGHDHNCNLCSNNTLYHFDLTLKYCLTFSWRKRGFSSRAFLNLAVYSLI